MVLPVRVVARAHLDPDAELVAEWVRDTDDGPLFSLGDLDLRYGRYGWNW